MGNLRWNANNILGNATLTVTGSWGEDSGFPKTNLYNKRASKRGGFDTAKAGELVMDFGAAVAVDHIALINHNLTSGATVTLQGNAADVWGAPAYSKVVPYAAENMAVEFTDETYRYWRLVVSDAGRAANDIKIGELVLGTTVLLSVNFDWDLREVYQYRNVSHVTLGGNVWSYPLADVRSWVMSWGQVTAVELAPIITLIDTVIGNGIPFLVFIEDLPYFCRMDTELVTTRPLGDGQTSVTGITSGMLSGYPVDRRINSLVFTSEPRGIGV